jgi:excisionase family DNA binding protein
LTIVSEICVPNATDDEYVRVPALARELKVTRQTVYSWIDKGLLPATQPRRAVLVRRSDVERFLEARRRGTPDPDAFLGEDAADVLALEPTDAFLGEDAAQVLALEPTD